jgi:hypothetical protein
VSPTPVGINDNGAGLVSTAASGSALLPGQRRVSFSLQCASLLGTDCRRQGGEKEGALVHRCEGEGSGLQYSDGLFSGLQLKNKKTRGCLGTFISRFPCGLLSVILLYRT